MILKPFTGICLLAAAGSGLYLYQTKHHAQVLERNIARTMKATDAVRQRAGLMRAEYALLNDPSRLAELSEQLLPGLKTTAPGQFASLADFEKRLPAIGALPTPEPLEPQAPDAVLPKAAPKPEQVVTEPPKVEPAKPEPPRQPLVASRPAPPRPTVLAAAAPSALAVAATPLPPVAPAPSAAVVATPLPPVVATPLAPPRPPAAPIAATPAATQPFAAPRPASPPAAAPLPLHAATAPARPVAPPIVATPIIARPAPSPAIARPAYAPPAYPPPTYAPQATPAVGSALGMARNMPAASVLTPAQGPAFAPYGRQ